MKLIVTEKPSVAMTIAKALHVYDRKDGYVTGNDYAISWCVGHLVSLADADVYDERYKKWHMSDLPIIPNTWEYVVNPSTKQQYDTLVKLMQDKSTTEIICATDAGREGELIFRLVYNKAKCTKPFKRLWISSMEESAIKQGFNNLKDGSAYDNLYAAAVCRSQADWLVGINASRLFSLFYNSRLNVGRVQTPTLAMLAERNNKINNFVKEKYFEVNIDTNGITATSQRINEQKVAQQMVQDCNGNTATCTQVDKKQCTVNPPRLYDLTTLQREANRIYGYTAQQTLDATQSLYEQKLVTYPRTDSQYITDDMQDTVAAIVKQLNNSITPDTKRITNNEKVTDHHAIIPTIQKSRTALPKHEGDILALVESKLICATAAPHVYEELTATFDVNGHSFVAKGKTVTSNGWKSYTQECDKNKDKSLPEIAQGQVFDKIKSALSEHHTSPPKAYTEDTLLMEMERAGNKNNTDDEDNKGIGTPATRASILEKLVASEFVERKNKQLVATEKGMKLIKVLPDTLTSPILTSEWETSLKQIERGQASKQDFINRITDFTKRIIADNNSKTADGSLFQQQKEVIGVCPRCNNNVFESKTNFYCSNKECTFALWKNDKFFVSKKKTLTQKIASDLLSKGKVSVKGLFSDKKNSTYDAVILLDDTGKYVNYKMEFAKR